MTKKLIYALFALLLLAPVTGELWRFSLFGLNFLPSDLIIPVLFVVWGIDKIRNDRRLRLGKIGRMIVLFLFVLAVTYLINLYRFDFRQMLAAFSHMGRFGMYLVIALMAFDLLDREEKGDSFRRLLVGGMTVSMTLICLLGFLQLFFFPSFLELGLYLEGWDPHIGRLLSTWFDPNFVGGYLAFMLGPVIGLALYFRQRGDRRLFWLFAALAALALVALYLTFSRSGYLALMATLGLLSLFKSRKLLMAGFLAVLLAFAFSPRVQERSLEAWDSGKALFGLDSQKPLDPTAELRVWSWSFAREIIADHPWVGVGYGRYAYEINERGHGLLSDHSSGGSDSSMLTIWASSGIFGLLSYLAIGFVAAVTAVKRFRGSESWKGYLSAGFLAGFGGTLIHSLFVNSLLYTLMMVYLMVGLGLLDERA